MLAGLDAARAAGLEPVKVNSVLLRGMNDDEAVPLLRFCVENGYHLRFIEQMPLDPQHGWTRTNMVTAEEILDMLSDRVHAHAGGNPRGGAPADAGWSTAAPLTSA